MSAKIALPKSLMPDSMDSYAYSDIASGGQWMAKQPSSISLKTCKHFDQPNPFLIDFGRGRARNSSSSSRYSISLEGFRKGNLGPPPSDANGYGLDILREESDDEDEAHAEHSMESMSKDDEDHRCLLAESARTGARRLQVTRQPSRLKRGQEIVIDPDGPNMEKTFVVGFGSLMIDPPLRHYHWAGEEVKLLDNFKKDLSTSDSEEEYSLAEDSDTLEEVSEEDPEAIYNKMAKVLRPNSGFHGASFPKPKPTAVAEADSEGEASDETERAEVKPTHAPDILLLGSDADSEDGEDEGDDEYIEEPIEYDNIYFHHGKLVKAAPSMILALFDDGTKFVPPEPEQRIDVTRPRSKSRGRLNRARSPVLVRTSYSAGDVSRDEHLLATTTLMGTTVDLSAKAPRRLHTAGPPVKPRAFKNRLSRRQRMAESRKKRTQRKLNKLAKADAARAPKEEAKSADTGTQKTVPWKEQEDRRRRRQQDASDDLSDRTQDFYELEGFEDDEADGSVDLLRQIAYREKHRASPHHDY